jgi:hypothetical protein
MDDIINRKRKGMGCALILPLVLACIAATTVALDRLCVEVLQWRVPVHPEARIVRQSYNFLTPNGLGQSVTTYFVKGDPREIELWFNRQIGERLRALDQAPERSFYYRISAVSKIVGVAEDGVNTQLIVIAQCMSSRGE